MADHNIVEKVIALENVKLLSALSPDQLARIASIASDVAAIPGQVILSPDQPADAMFVILDGAVELSKDGHRLEVAGPDQVLGSWALFDDQPNPLTATSLEYSKLLRISRLDFLDLLADNSEMTTAIVSTMARRFRQLLET